MLLCASSLTPLRRFAFADTALARSGPAGRDVQVVARERMAFFANLAAAPIETLLGTGRPSAVRRLVVAAVVFSIKRPAFGPLTHIRKEVLEVAPAFADCYPARAIVFEGKVPRVRAPRDHPAPRFISRASGTTVLQTLTTPARSCGTDPKCRAAYHHLVAAITAARPGVVARRVARKT